MITWVKEWCYAWFICRHVKSTWYMREMGMGKIKYCDECGRCVDLV